MDKHETLGSVQSVGKALNLLDILLKKKLPMELKELSEESGYPKSTVHALLSTLKDYSIVVQKQDGKYFLGTHLFELGCAVSASWNISSIGHSYLEKLAYESKNSSFLAILDEMRGLTFDNCSASEAFHIVAEIGARLPLHATCQGKMLLAGLSDDDIRYRLSKTELIAYTGSTIVDVEQFIEHIQKVRTQGYALEDCEFREGVRAVAAPIYDRDGKIKYVLGSVGLFKSINSEDFRKTVNLTVEYAKKLSRELGSVIK